MENITTVESLKEAIQLLETEKAIKAQQLKDEFSRAIESLKPINILKKTVAEVSASPKLIDSILGTTMGLVTGYLSRKLVVGRSANFFRNILGTIMQFGVSRVVSQNPTAIKSVGHFIYSRIFRKNGHEHIMN